MARVIEEFYDSLRRVDNTVRETKQAIKQVQRFVQEDPEAAQQVLSAAAEYIQERQLW